MNNDMSYIYSKQQNQETPNLNKEKKSAGKGKDNH